MLFFVCRDVTLASTFHQAFDGQTCDRKVKDRDGRVKTVKVPIPGAVNSYNEFMGGVDHSDALIKYYNVLHKTRVWYRTLFYHAVDIAVVNAFILYKAQCVADKVPHDNHLTFRERLVFDMFNIGAESTSQRPKHPPPAADQTHKPLFISEDGTKGRQKCKHCKKGHTGVICQTCKVSLCFMPKRDCYNAWHEENGL